MRVFIVKEKTDLETLAGELTRSRVSPDRLLTALQNLNPQVDFADLAPGTVLLVPDLEGLRLRETTRVASDMVDNFRSQVAAALDAIEARVTTGHEALTANAKEMTGVFRSAAFKRALESDPELKPQVEAAQKVFEQDQEDAKAAARNLERLRRESTAELDELARLLG